MIEKVPEFRDDFAEKMFGEKISEAQFKATCVICKAEVLGFRDALSEKEYAISGMCQKCQDGVFGGDEE